MPAGPKHASTRQDLTGHAYPSLPRQTAPVRNMPDQNAPRLPYRAKEPLSFYATAT